MENTLKICKYNCVLLELERSMIKIFGTLEQKFVLAKMRAFLKIQQIPSPIIDLVAARTSKVLSENLLKLFNCKLINNKTNAFFLIKKTASENRKLRKYDLA